MDQGGGAVLTSRLLHKHKRWRAIRHTAGLSSMGDGPVRRERLCSTGMWFSDSSRFAGIGAAPLLTRIDAHQGHECARTRRDGHVSVRFAPSGRSDSCALCIMPVRGVFNLPGVRLYWNGECATDSSAPKGVQATQRCFELRPDSCCFSVMQALQPNLLEYFKPLDTTNVMFWLGLASEPRLWLGFTGLWLNDPEAKAKAASQGFPGLGFGPSRGFMHFFWFNCLRPTRVTAIYLTDSQDAKPGLQAPALGFPSRKPKPKPSQSRRFGLAWLQKPGAWLHGFLA
ncbi:hypothetical protein C8R43DRAFT_1114593 [Mycena crocata]|nr:hypothetical protein C8R43DRAFT_1114593 [Mycena crocata]